jgi:hypothetical protein
MSRHRSYFVPGYRAIFIPLIIVTILVLLGISLKKNSRSGPLTIDKTKMEELLARHHFDYFGRKLEASAFTARPILLIFMNAKKDIDLLLFREVFTEWNAQGLNLVVIADDPSSVFTEPVISADGVWILSDETREIRDLFGVSSVNSSFILFDERGDQIAAGESAHGYRQGLRIYLRKALRMRPPLRTAFAPVGKFLKDIDWLRDMRSTLVNSGGRGSIIAFFNAFCETCNSWTILERLKEFRARSEMRPLLIFSEDFSFRDVINFEARYAPGFPVAMASRALSDKLRELRNDYFHAELNNIMILTSNEGEIIECADAECACYQDVIRKAEEMIMNGGQK